MSMCILTAHARTNVRLTLVARHFSLKSLHKMAFVRCSCVFRLCRLAQNGCPALGPFYHDLARVSCCTLGGPSDLWRSWQSSCGDPCEKMLRTSRWNPVTGPCMFLNRSLWEDLMKIWVTSSSKRSLHDLAQVPIRRSCWDPDIFLSKRSCVIPCRSYSEDLVQILVRSTSRAHCLKILQMPCLRRTCIRALLGCSWEVLVSRSCKIPSSSRSFYEDLVSFSHGSWRDDLGQGLVEILVACCQRPLHEPLHDLAQVLCEKLLKSHLVQVLVWRSCGDPVEIFLKGSLH